VERRLLVTATRGVVQLFNAVSKAQKAGGGAAGDDAAGASGGTLASRAAAAKAAPRVFLQELRKAAAGGPPPAAAPPPGRAAAGWDVLGDSYARGGSAARLRAWDKPGQASGGPSARLEGAGGSSDDGEEADFDDDV